MSMQSPIPILVTGGAGYIGSHACLLLSENGYLPISYDSMIHGHEWAVQWGPLEVGDIRDQPRLRSVIDKYQPKAVMHFASFINVGESVQNPKKYFENNVEGTQDLLRCLAPMGIQKFLFSSTAAVYGDPKEIPIPEEHPTNPVNPYGETKLEMEKMLEKLAQENKMSSIVLRYFNAAGADPQSRIGEDHEPETHLIPIILEVALGKRKELQVYGNDYPTEDGTCVRDYIHVSDLARAHLLALRRLLNESDESSTFHAFNLGSETGASVLEIIRLTEEVTGKKIPYRISPRREGDPSQLIASSERILRELDWKPEISERTQALKHIIQTAWDWHRKGAR